MCPESTTNIRLFKDALFVERRIFVKCPSVQVAADMQSFQRIFMDQVSSDGAVAAMAEFQKAWIEAKKVARQAKVHVVEVFILKALKQVEDAKAKGELNAISEGKQVLSRQLSSLSSEALEMSEDLVCPWLVSEARRVHENKASAAT